MKGIQDWNYPAFNAAVVHLKDLGHTPINPAALFNGDTSMAPAVYYRAGLVQLLLCDAIYMLQGWENSFGATLEYKIAKALGLLISHQGRYEEFEREVA